MNPWQVVVGKLRQIQRGHLDAAEVRDHKIQMSSRRGFLGSCSPTRYTTRMLRSWRVHSLTSPISGCRPLDQIVDVFSPLVRGRRAASVAAAGTAEVAVDDREKPGAVHHHAGEGASQAGRHENRTAAGRRKTRYWNGTVCGGVSGGHDAPCDRGSIRGITGYKIADGADFLRAAVCRLFSSGPWWAFGRHGQAEPTRARAATDRRGSAANLAGASSDVACGDRRRRDHGGRAGVVPAPTVRGRPP